MCLICVKYKTNYCPEPYSCYVLKNKPYFLRLDMKFIKKESFVKEIIKRVKDLFHKETSNKHQIKN